jgi:bacteriocin-like protein
MSQIEITNLQSAELFEELSDAELTTVVGGASATVDVNADSKIGLDEDVSNAIVRFVGLDSANTKYAQELIKRLT